MAKRFYKTVRVAGETGGYGIRLDDRALKTPAHRPLILPSEALARAIAAEWESQGPTLRPDRLLLTRLANTAVDRMADHRQPVIDEIAGYGRSDLLCYRAAGPAALRARQDAGWQPLVDWAAERLGAELRITEGIVPVDQDEAALAALRSVVAAHSVPALTALREAVGISGSLILALAVAHGRLEAEAAWRLSQVDETFQSERWGVDEEAAERQAGRRSDFLTAARFLDLVLSCSSV